MNEEEPKGLSRTTKLMRVSLAELQRRAQNLQSAGLYSYVDPALDIWRRSAEAVGAWESAAEAATRAVRFALDYDRLDLALTRGVDALPYVLGRSRVDPNVRARLYINLTKAAWGLGRDTETRAYLDAARCTVENEPVQPHIRVHLGITAAITAIEDGDGALATSWALQALDVATEAADEATVMLCRQNLSYIWASRGCFDQAADVLSGLLAHSERDVDLVDVLVTAIPVALGLGDLVCAGRYARRAVAAYCAAPSRLSPLSVAYLFEGLAAYHGAQGANPAAHLLGSTARAWFGLRHRACDVARVDAWLAHLADGPDHALSSEVAVDPDLLYLGELLRAAWASQNGALARSLAFSVNRLLPEVAPQAPPTPCEHAALLWPLSTTERWFTGQSTTGQAAERVLAGGDVAGQRGLKLLAGYERLAAAGASWGQSVRVLRKQGVDPGGLQVLDELHRAATA